MIRKHHSIHLLILTIALFLGTMRVSAYIDHRNVRIDSLEMVLHGSNPPKGQELIEIYLDLMRAYLPINSERCEFYARKLLEESYKVKGFNIRESAWYHLGLIAYGNDCFDEALMNFNQALAVTDSMKNDIRYDEATIDNNYSQLYGAIGNLYNLQDKLHLAIEYYQKALPIFEKNKWLESQSILYHNVGELYMSMGNKAEAERNFLSSLQKGTESNDSLMVALARKGLSKVYLALDDIDKAKENAEKAFAYYHSHQAEDYGDYTQVLVSLARIFMKEGQDFQKAKDFANEALGFVNRDLMSENRQDIYAVNCEIAIKEHQWKKALEYGLNSIHEDPLSTYNDISSFVLLAQIYMELGEKEKAKEYVHKIYNDMEHFATAQYQSGLSQMEVIYETKKKEADIVQLKKEKRWLIAGGILTALILLLIALLLFLQWRNIRIQKKNELIKAKLDGELSERVRIARDLHDRLGGLLTAIKQSVGAQDQASALTDQAIQEMRNVSHHLLPDSLNRYGLRFALRDFCSTFKNVSFSFIGEDKHIPHEETIYCIVHELVNNAVKSADAKHIRVQLLCEKDYTAINVSDDGNGLLTKEKQEGMGLRNIEERIFSIGGTFDIYSKPQEGTEINIEIKNELNKIS
ncbi:MAG: DUF2225 domain-containing protein [Phocaeicola sp.]|nr:DUF2225 domain-containing protein [Phocaeicola sp.]